MTNDPYDAQAPTWLEDEILLVEHSGEMPEVAMAESLHHLGDIAETEINLLRAAVARGYLNIIERDLEAEHVGLPLFRGLERAAQNLERLKTFLERLGWPPPAQRWSGLAPRLARYLEAEQAALEAGRDYASATPEQVRRVAALVGLDLAPFGGLLERMGALPALDFLALRAMARLSASPEAAAKRRRESGGKARLEVLDSQGRPLQEAEMNLVGADGREDPHCRRRVEQVWRLIQLPEV